LSFQQIGEEDRRTFLVSNFASPMGVLRNRKQAVEHFSYKDENPFCSHSPLPLAHRQASSQTSRSNIDELPERHHLHEPYISRLLALPRTDFPMKANLLLTNNPLN
jgi:hypothetical protein